MTPEEWAHKFHTTEPFICYQVGGGGGGGGLGGAVKNMALKGKGGSEEKYWVKIKGGGGAPNNSSKFCSDSICNKIFLLQTAYQNAKDQRFWHSDSSDFPGEACPWPRYFITH